MFLTAYSYISDPITGKLPVYECIESIYDEVDEINIYDTSVIDHVDLSKYEKVKKHVRGIFNNYDNPIGSAFTAALKLVESDTCFCLDIDEIYSFKKEGLRDIIKKFPLDSTNAGIAFSLTNYYCSRHFVLDGCSTRGPVIFRNQESLSHDIIRGFEVMYNNLRRTTTGPDKNDGARIVDSQGTPMPHWSPIPTEDVSVEHTSHIDPISKLVRSVLQFNHTSTLDLKEFYPYDMRFQKATIDKIYKYAREDLEKKEFLLYGDPIPFNYEKNELLEKFIERADIKEFDPTDHPRIKSSFTGCL